MVLIPPGPDTTWTGDIWNQRPVSSTQTFYPYYLSSAHMWDPHLLHTQALILFPTPILILIRFSSPMLITYTNPFTVTSGKLLYPKHLFSKYFFFFLHMELALVMDHSLHLEPSHFPHMVSQALSNLRWLSQLHWVNAETVNSFCSFSLCLPLSSWAISISCTTKSRP